MSEYTKTIKAKGISEKTIFIATFFISVFGILLWGKESVMTSSLLDTHTLLNIEMKNPKMRDLLLYVVRERWWPIPLLFMMSTTYLGKSVRYLMTAWYGMGIGVVFGILLLRYALKGILLMIGAAIPHYLLYIASFLLSLKMLEERRVVNRKFVVQLIMLEAIVLLGCVCEATVTPILVKKLIHIL